MNSDEHWIPLADLMTGLMMMFLLVAVLYMLRIDNAMHEYHDIKDNLGKELCKEFHKDLQKWDAECDEKGLLVRFKSPDVLFDTGQSKLKPNFQTILADFFPRYIKVVNQEKYRYDVTEIRIEGHTSSKWRFNTSPEQAYFLNMQLSQARTLSVLQYVLSLPNVENKNWVKQNLTANGLSSSKLLYLEDGTENQQGSQRVEFRIRANSEKYIENMTRDLSVK